MPLPGKQCRNVRVLIGVMSTAGDWQRRQYIRSTWKQYSNVYHHQHNPAGTVLVVFAVGIPNA